MTTCTLMGTHRALNAMDMRVAAAARAFASAPKFRPEIRARAKRKARGLLEGLKATRLMIGADGYRLP